MKLLEGKTALVTGATRGIGRAIAVKFAQEGANVAFTYRQINNNAEELIKEIEALGVKCKGYAADAADYAATEAVVKDVAADFGRIDILVNNAGITKDGLILRMTEEQWDAVIGTNLKSAFNFTRAAVPVMAKQRAGSIINMSSVVGENGNAGQCNYAASKAGLIGLAKSIAKEIAPGFIMTDLTAAIPEEMRAEWAKTMPLRRAGTPEDVANVAVFLGSDMSAYVSGQVINCCGAMSC